MCVAEGTLRMKLDGELASADSLAVDNHLSVCADCRRRAEVLAAQSEHVHGLLSELTPLSGEAPTNARVAYTRFRARHHGSDGGRISMWNRLFARHLRPVWGALIAVAIVVTIGSFTPMAAWAEKVLGLFRIKKIAVVSINPQRLRADDDQNGRQIGQLLSDSVVITKKPGQPQTASSAEEASGLAGFPVRLLSGRADIPELSVKDSQAFQLTVDLPRLQIFLDEAGRSDLSLPASLNGATVAVDIPKGVMAIYGDCSKKDPGGEPRGLGKWSDCMVLAQIPTPTAMTPSELNLAEIAVVGLQLVGMSEDEARAFSDAIDWTSTLVVPIPMDVASSESVEVDGVRGTLITENRRGDRPSGYTLLWVKNGIIYSLMGSGSPSDAVVLANSLE